MPKHKLTSGLEDNYSSILEIKRCMEWGTWLIGCELVPMCMGNPSFTETFIRGTSGIWKNMPLRRPNHGKIHAEAC